jgi:hypothetical protein
LEEKMTWKFDRIRICGKNHAYCKICNPNAKFGHSISASQRQQISERHIGKVVSQDVRNKISKTLTGVSLTEERKKKVSEGLKRAYIEGRAAPGPTHRSKKTKYAKIWFKSRMEAAFAKWLDSRNIRWQYEPQRFQISIGSYLPDFYLPDKNIWVEVKGRHVGLDKFKAFKKEYHAKAILADGDYFARKSIPFWNEAR